MSGTQSYCACLLTCIAACFAAQAKAQVTGIMPKVEIPAVKNFTPVNIGQLQMPGIPPSQQPGGFIDLGMPDATQKMIASDLYKAGLEPAGAQLHRELMEIGFYRAHYERLEQTKAYRNAYYELKQLNPDNFSLARAVFLVENAWYGNRQRFEDYMQRMKLEADLIEHILKAEGIKSRDDLALNYAIQKRFRSGATFFDPKTKTYKTARPFQYDFNDIMGEKQYSQLFTIKMLISGKGQCHSLPLVYLIIAELVGAKAWLSLSPQHSFIRFADKRGKLQNFETTSANVVSSNWMHQSGYITAAALKNGLYMDTLSKRQLYAQVMADLLLGYLNKFGYDDFTEQLKAEILQLNPNNLAALIVDANVKQYHALQLIRQAGMPKENELDKYPDAYRAYQEMQAAHQRIDDTGFQDMPKEAYQRWLKSFETEKKKRENVELQQRLKAEMERLKRATPQTTVTDKTKS